MGVFSSSLETEVRIERMRPDQIQAAVSRRPAAYIPFGSLEWHGRQNPVGLDAIKAHEQLVGLAVRVGGVVFPPVFFGVGGGHADYPWSYMVGTKEMTTIVEQWLHKLERDGFRSAICLAGHYPNGVGPDQFLQPAVAAYLEDGGRMKVLCLLERDAPGVEGDHAAKNETSFMLYLHPETVDMSKLEGHEGDIGGPEARMNWMQESDKEHPCYGILGVDPRAHASAKHGRESTESLITHLEAWLRKEAI